MGQSVIHERVTATVDANEIVVFLIGMRVNRWWKPWRWLPVAWAMGRMMRELADRPEAGLLGSVGSGPGVMVQYWSSFEALVRYAADRDGEHYPAWAAFNRALKDSGDVGIWHETYVVDASRIECIYHHMPPTGLATFSSHIEALGPRRGARGRMKQA